MKKSGSFLRILALFLALALLAPALVSCSKYREAKSSASDRMTVVTLDGYEVPYELYRYLYLGYLDAYREADAKALAVEATERALRALYGIYASAADAGVDTDSIYVRDSIENYMEEVIDSYSSRRAYLRALASLHSSDWIFRFLARTDVVEWLIFDQIYDGSWGEVDISDEAVYDYLASDNCYAYYMIELYRGEEERWQTRAEEMYARALACETAAEFRALYGYSLSSYTETIDGYLFYVGLGEIDERYEQILLSLGEGEVSELIEDGQSYFIFRRAAKSALDAKSDSGFRYLKTSYVNFCQREITRARGEEMALTYTDFDALLARLTAEVEK